MSLTSLLGITDSMPGNIAVGWSRSIVCNAQSHISLYQSSSGKVTFPTAAELVISLIGFTEDTQGDDALVFAILQFAAGCPVRRDLAYFSPFDEVINRFRNLGVNVAALSFLERYFNSRNEAYLRRPQ